MLRLKLGEASSGAFVVRTCTHPEKKIPYADEHFVCMVSPFYAARGVRKASTCCLPRIHRFDFLLLCTAACALLYLPGVCLPQGNMVTADMRMDRVRVYFNTEKIVTRPPRVG